MPEELFRREPNIHTLVLPTPERRPEMYFDAKAEVGNMILEELKSIDPVTQFTRYCYDLVRLKHIVPEVFAHTPVDQVAVRAFTKETMSGVVNRRRTFFPDVEILRELIPNTSQLLSQCGIDSKFFADYVRTIHHTIKQRDFGYLLECLYTLRLMSPSFNAEATLNDQSKALFLTALEVLGYETTPAATRFSHLGRLRLSCPTYFDEVRIDKQLWDRMVNDFHERKRYYLQDNDDRPALKATIKAEVILWAQTLMIIAAEKVTMTETGLEIIQRVPPVSDETAFPTERNY